MILSRCVELSCNYRQNTFYVEMMLASVHLC
jgi:hypothetical protein